MSRPALLALSGLLSTAVLALPGCRGNLFGLDEDNDGFDPEEDCDDANPATYPGAPELCDGLDNDCDGFEDDGLVFRTWYEDADLDGFGDVNGEAVTACWPDPVDGFAATADDCDDSDPDIRPNASDVCNDRDDDCDELVDEDAPWREWWPDVDGDEFGDARTLPFDSCANQEDHVNRGGDCDDERPEAFPGADELCNDLDDDCDDEVDEGIDCR